MLISPKCSVSVILATHNCLKNESDVDARAHWGLVSTVLDGDDNNPWPRTWMLDTLPTTWFPRCRRHLGPRGAGPRKVYTIAVQDADCRIQLATHGSMRIDLVECENASCLEGHHWADAQARQRWPAVVALVDALLLPGSGPADVDVSVLPSRDDCLKHLVHQHWIGHTAFPVPCMQNVLVLKKTFCDHSRGALQIFPSPRMADTLASGEDGDRVRGVLNVLFPEEPDEVEEATNILTGHSSLAQPALSNARCCQGTDVLCNILQHLQPGLYGRKLDHCGQCIFLGKTAPFSWSI
jgi:hypothetical protein